MNEISENIKSNFLNKICTVLTHQTSFNFNDAVQHSQYFTGKVAEVNEYGIWLKHLHVDTYAFFFFPVIGIVEEQVIEGNDPRASKIQEELKKNEYEVSPNFIPVESLTKMIRE